MHYKIRFILSTCLIVVLFMASSAFAEEDFFDSYYRSPNPNRVAAEFAKIDTVKKPMSDSADLPLGMFLSEIFVNNPEIADTLVKQAKQHSPTWRYTVAIAVCQARLPNKKKMLQQLLHEKDFAETKREMLENTFPPLAGVQPRSPAVIDAFWGGFIASGNTAYVEKVISALGYTEGKNGEKNSYTQVQMAANWSLESMAKYHPLVLETCKKIAAAGSLPGPSQTVLEGIIKKASAAAR